jgi:hypothetical protein
VEIRESSTSVHGSSAECSLDELNELIIDAMIGSRLSQIMILTQPINDGLGVRGTR